MNEQALKDRIRAIAISEKQSFHEIWKSLILERLLVRLMRSKLEWQGLFSRGQLFIFLQ